MSFRSLGVEFVAKGLNNFTRGIDRVNRSLKAYGRAKIEAARADVYAARSANSYAQAISRNLQRNVDSLTRSILRYSDASLKMRINLGDQGRITLTNIEASKRYINVLGNLVQDEKKRRDIVNQLVKSGKQNVTQLRQTEKALRDSEDATAEYIDQSAKMLTANIKNKTEQQRMEKVVKSLLLVFVEKTQSIEDLNTVLDQYTDAQKEAGKASADLKSKEGIWKSITDKFMKLGQVVDGVQTAFAYINPVVSAVAGVFRTLTGVLGKVLGVIGNVAMAIGRTLFNALKKIVSIPINMIKGLFNTLTGSLQRIFEIIVGMNASRLLWGLGRKLVELGKTAYKAAEDFQFLTIRLEALMRRELIDAGYSSSEAMGLVTGEVKELTNWVSRLAVLSPIGAKEIADTMTLAMSYDFTSKEAQKLTESIIKFSTAMGLGDVEVQRIIENFGQMRQQQKITGQELRDLARGAFVPVTDILKRMGVNLELISGIKIPSLTEINRTFIDLRDSGQLTFEEFENIDSGLREMAVGSSISAAGLKNLYDRGILTNAMMEELGISTEDLNTVMSDAHFEDMKDQLDDLIATGEVSLDEFFWAFTDIVEDDFSDALTNASNSMRVARDNAKDFIETMIGWRVITPILNIVSDRVSKALQSLMAEDVMTFFDNLGSALATITEFFFDFTDSLLNLSAYENTIGSISRVLNGLFQSITAMGKGEFSSEILSDVSNGLLNLGMSIEGINQFTGGIRQLNEVFNGMEDATPGERWSAFWESFKMMVAPVWEEFVKPELIELYDNIKVFIVDKWNNDIKPALADFATETLLPGLEKFITETIPSWASAIEEYVGPMADTLRTGLWTALDELSSWAEENQPGGALDLAFGLIKSLAEFLGITKMPENPMANWMPEYGPKAPENKFESSGLAQALKDISESVESLIANSDLLQNNVITPLQNLAESEWGKGFDSMIRMFESLANLASGPGETVANILGIIATILGLETEGGGGGGTFWKIGGFINNIVTGVADLLAFPLDLFNAWLVAVQEFLDIISESSNITWDELPTWDLSEVQLFKDIERIFGGEESSGPLDSMNTWLEDFETANADITTAVDDFISQGAVRTADISAIGNEGSYDQVPFEGILKDADKGFEDFYGNELGESPSAKLKEIEVEISKVGNEGSYDRLPFEDMTKGAEDLWQTLRENLILQSIIPDMLEDIVSYLAENMPRITEEFTKTTTDIKTNLEETELKPYGESMMQGLLDGMQLKFAEILTWWQFTALPQLTAIMDTLFDFGSPSKVFKEYGKLMMEGLLVGIKGEQRQVLNTMTTGMSDLRGVAGYVNNNNNSSVSNNYNTSMDNRNIVINMNQPAGNLSLDYDYVRAIT